MNRQDLAIEIARIRNEEQVDSKALIAQEFILHPNRLYLKSAFDRVRLSDEKWHQFARFVLASEETWRYMYERLARLLNAHRGSYDNFFRLRMGSQTGSLLDRMSDLIRFRRLYEEFFDIHSQIIGHIQVDRPPHERAAGIIHGKINWRKTLQKPGDPLHMRPVMKGRRREFAVAENILWYLCITWLRQEAAKLLNAKFSEPLRTDEVQLLRHVESGADRMDRNFPSLQIRQSGERLARLMPTDGEITRLIKEAQLRIRNGRVRNSGYADLLEWIGKLRGLGLQALIGSPTRFHIDSTAHLDSVYEAWIFMELVHFCRTEKDLDVRLVFGDGADRDTFLEFRHLGRKITVFYGRRFSSPEERWILQHVPDFSAFADGRLIGVFDAKNYSREGEKQDGINKMLAYMTNLDADYGALFFPMVRGQKKYVREGEGGRAEQTLAYYRMDPTESEDAIRAKNESLESVLSEILGRAGA